MSFSLSRIAYPLNPLRFLLGNFNPIVYKVWLFYSGASQRMDANPGVYLAMSGREQYALDRGIVPANEHVEIIERGIQPWFNSYLLN
jgi:hypothetical protein